MYVIFDDQEPETKHQLPELSDAAIEHVLESTELSLGYSLPRDHRTQFPTFTVYLDGGEEIGGG